MGKFSPFYVTGNEVRCSEDLLEQYSDVAPPPGWLNFASSASLSRCSAEPLSDELTFGLDPIAVRIYMCLDERFSMDFQHPCLL